MPRPGAAAQRQDGRKHGLVLVILGILAAIALSSQASATWHAPPAIVGLSGAEVRAVEVGSDGSVWLAVRSRGLARLRGTDVEWVGTDDGLVSDGVASLHEDGAGRLWAAGLGGFSLLTEGRWVPHRTVGSLQPRVVFDVYEETRTGSIWLATNGGAGRQTVNGWQVLQPSDGLPHAVVHAVVVDRDGVAWLACRRGLARVENEVVSVFFPEVNFRSALVDIDGTVWFGTPQGVYAWDGSSWTRHLEGQAVFPLLLSETGSIWAGALESGLLRYDDNRWSTIGLPENLRGAEIFDLSEGADGSIWVATSAGAARYDPGER